MPLGSRSGSLSVRGTPRYLGWISTAWLPRRRGLRHEAGDGQRGSVTLTDDIIEAHFQGRHEWHVMGLHPAGEDNLCRFIVIDIDCHVEGEGDAETVKRNFNAALHWWNKLRQLGFRPWLIDSNGNGGISYLDHLLRTSHNGRWISLGKMARG